AEDRIRRRAPIEARNVLGYRAVKQRYILRQIADVPPELVWSPIVQRRAVEPDDTFARGPNSEERSRERRLACRARSEQCQAHSGGQFKGDVRQDDAVAARNRDGDVFDRKTLPRPSQIDRRGRGRRYGRQDFAKSIDTLPG